MVENMLGQLEDLSKQLAAAGCVVIASVQRKMPDQDRHSMTIIEVPEGSPHIDHAMMHALQDITTEWYGASHPGETAPEPTGVPFEGAKSPSELAGVRY